MGDGFDSVVSLDTLCCEFWSYGSGLRGTDLRLRARGLSCHWLIFKSSARVRLTMLLGYPRKIEWI